MHVCVQVRVHGVCEFMWLCVHVSVYVCECVSLCAWKFVSLYVCMCVYLFMHVCM